MATTQTRRRFMTNVAMAGAAGFVGSPRVAAAPGALKSEARATEQRIVATLPGPRPKAHAASITAGSRKR